MRSQYDSSVHRRLIVLSAAVALALPLTAPRVFAGVPHLLAATELRDDKDTKQDDKHDQKREKASAKEDREVFTAIGALLDQLVEPDLNGVRKLLTTKDAERVGDELKRPHESYATVVNNFREAWQNKYGDKFNASNHLGILSADGVERTQKDGKNHARVYFEEQAGKPAFALVLIEQEPGQYRVNIPANVDGHALVSRLETNLKGTFDNKEDWPKEQSQAYAQAAHRLLYALRTDEAAEKPANH